MGLSRMVGLSTHKTIKTMAIKAFYTAKLHTHMMATLEAVR